MSHESGPTLEGRGATWLFNVAISPKWSLRPLTPYSETAPAGNGILWSGKRCRSTLRDCAFSDKGRKTGYRRLTVAIAMGGHRRRHRPAGAGCRAALAASLSGSSRVAQNLETPPTRWLAAFRNGMGTLFRDPIRPLVGSVLEGLDRQAYSLSNRSGNEAPDAMGLPAGGRHDLGQGRSPLSAQ